MKQDKVLPGSYINFVSASRAAAELSDRGRAAMPLLMDWGPSEEVFVLEAGEVQKHCKGLFGYDYSHEAVRGIHDLFKNARTLYGYRINGKGSCAACDYGTARYAGIRGNDLRLIVLKEGEAYTVRTLLDGKEVNTQTASNMAGLSDHEYVVFKKDAALSETAGMPFTGGTNSVPELEDYQEFLDRIQNFSFHALGLISDAIEVKKLFADFTKLMRDEMGIKFQTVLFRHAGDYEGIVSLENHTADSASAGKSRAGKAELEADACALVYWTTGTIAGCAVNASNTNRIYDGEYAVDASYTQKALEDAVRAGKFVLHKVGDEIRVLEDINTLVTFTEDKGKDFSSNQTVRVLDQIGNDLAALFGSKYIGKIPNDAAGRISFWNDVVTYYRELEKIRAIENFKADDIVITKGEGKKTIVASCPVTPVNAMSQLYMTVIVQ